MDQRPALHDVPTFKSFSAVELKLVSDIARTKRYKKNQTIFLEGEPFSGFYVVLSGSVQLYKVARTGDEVLLKNVGANGIFAESAFLAGADFYLSCAKAVEDSTLLFIPITEFVSILRSNPAFAVRLSDGFSVKLMQLNLKFDLLASTVEGRVARYLLSEIQLNDSVRLLEPFFTLAFQKKDIAAHLGMATETLSRTLRKLKGEKIIRQVSKKIFVTDLKKLRELTQD